MEAVKRIIIVGPTASGKTALSIQIAQLYDGEIICADSRTVYKELDIGTAKPSVAERQVVPHYGIDLVYPNQRFSAIKFKAYCTNQVAMTHAKQKIPIIVGGSGLYIDAYVFNYQPPPVDSNTIAQYQKLSVDELQAEIIKKQLALPKNYKNKLHLVNALARNGMPPSKGASNLENTIFIGIAPQKEVLKDRSTHRLQQMVANGVVEEAFDAYKKYGYSAPGLQGGIYKELANFAKGVVDIDTALLNTIKSDYRLAKRQMTWFKRNPYISWFTTIDDALRWINTNRHGTL